jgi:three-Cys-motif partner protein
MSENKYKLPEEKGSQICESQKSFGGPWTDEKLNTFVKYVNAYLTIMNKNRYWNLIYFDGFAGSGSRNEQIDHTISRLDLFHDIEEEELNVYQGAAERVLQIENKGFDQYIFVDIDQTSCNQLKDKLSKYKSKERCLEFKVSDANVELKQLSEQMHQDPNKYAALVFLDPFGMQIDSGTIESLKDTRTDLWILIPTGVIINRLLDTKGVLKFSDKLVSFFGMNKEEISDYFYERTTQQSLFGEESVTQKRDDSINKIAELCIRRLQTIFTYVTPKPLVLTNSKNVAIYHFAFASNNRTALKIANQIIGKQQR